MVGYFAYVVGAVESDKRSRDKHQQKLNGSCMYFPSHPDWNELIVIHMSLSSLTTNPWWARENKLNVKHHRASFFTYPIRVSLL